VAWVYGHSGGPADQPILAFSAIAVAAVIVLGVISAAPGRLWEEASTCLIGVGSVRSRSV